MNCRIKLLALILINSLYAGGQVFYSHNLNIETGLSNNFIRTIYKDSQGLMWFGTDTGLDSYDGLQIISHAKRFKTPLKGGIQSILELQENVFIVGTSWGAFQYDVRANEIKSIDFKTPAIDVRSVFKSSRGIIYCATDGGLFVLDNKTLAAAPFQLNQTNRPSLVSIAEDTRANIYVLGKDCVFKILPNKSVIQLSTVSDISRIRTALILNNTIYIGTENGLFIYDTAKDKLSNIKGLNNISILSLCHGGANNLYIGSDNLGIFKLNTHTLDLQLLQSNPMLPATFSSNTINALYFDQSKNLWVGTFDRGIDYLGLQNNKKFNTINFEGNSGSAIRSMYHSQDGRKYFGTRNGRLYCLDSNNRMISNINTTINYHLRSKIITTIHPFPDTPYLLLIGTFGGGAYIYNIKTTTFSDFSEKPEFQNGTIYKFLIDNTKQIWIATLNGLYRFNKSNSSFIRYNIAPVTGSNEIFSLFTDSIDKIWIGTKNGACYYSIKNKKLIQPASCRPYHYQCTSILVDKEKNTWFCFNKGGVLKIDKNLKQNNWFTSEIGLPENSPSSLIEDSEKNIWVGSSKGLFKINTKNEVHTYGLEDGLTTIGFCPESAIRDSSGKLWWTNDRGLVNYIVDKSQINLQTPKLKFTDLYINGTRYDADTLSYVKKKSDSIYTINIHGKSNNNLELRVVALNYQFAQKNQYSFFLDGLDKNWSRTSTNPIVAYNNLKPGVYTLNIKASNNDGIWTPVPTRITIKIIPYFYETIWFVILIFVILAGIVLYFTRTYIIRVKAKIVNQIEELKKKQGATTGILKITEKKGNEISQNLLAYMQDQKPYLNAELRQADVALAIGCSIHELSQVLNVQLNQNFSDFVNSYRVEEAKLRMKGPDAMKYTLTAIAMQCGFSAKSSFLRVFKKATNMTPSDYFKSVKAE